MAATAHDTRPRFLAGGRLLIALLVPLLLAACTQRPVPPREAHPLPPRPLVSPFPQGQFGGIFTLSLLGEPKTFNWLVSEDATSSAFINGFFEPLLGYNPITLEFEPRLAERWEVGADNKTFTFYLREGLRWSDGQPLTADDVLFTYRAIYDARYPNRVAFDLSDEGRPFQVTKLDDLTVRFTTPDIFAPFLLKMAGNEIVPRHVFQAAFDNGTLQKQWNVATAQKHPEQMIVSGAYRLHSYRPGERVVMLPNPHYYGADSAGQRLPYIDLVLYRFSKDLNSAMLAFAKGQTDLAEGIITPDNVAWVTKAAARHRATVHDRGPSTASNFLWFNQNPGKNADGKPYVEAHKLVWFQNTRFRQAVSTAINRQGIVDGVLFGRGAPLWGPESPANKKWFNPNVRQFPYDPAQALAMLQEEGFVLRDGKLHDAANNRVTFRLITNQENPIRQAMATVFKQNMAAIGIDVELQNLDFSSLVGKLSDTFEYEACLLGLTGSSDPSGGLSVFMSKGRLHQWYPSQPKPATDWEARIDHLMMAQMRTLDEAERKRHYDEVQAIMAEQCAFIYLITPNSYAGIKDQWQNVQPPPLGSLVWNFESIWTP